MTTKTTTTITHAGGCHCGAVTFEVEAPADVLARDCSCSICAATGFLHLIVGADDFKVTAGADNLSEYRFNTGVARHLFCKTCGVKAFYVPRSHPHGWSVNVNCLDMATVRSVRVEKFDGANWEANIESIT